MKKYPWLMVAGGMAWTEWHYIPQPKEMYEKNKKKLVDKNIKS